jgi:hypothetical protein
LPGANCIILCSKRLRGPPALVKAELGPSKVLLPARDTRKLTKSHMLWNYSCPNIRVDPQTFDVFVNGELATCEPARVLPLAQRSTTRQESDRGSRLGPAFGPLFTGFDQATDGCSQSWTSVQETVGGYLHCFSSEIQYRPGKAPSLMKALTTLLRRREALLSKSLTGSACAKAIEPTEKTAPLFAAVK